MLPVPLSLPLLACYLRMTTLLRRFRIEHDFVEELANLGRPSQERSAQPHLSCLERVLHACVVQLCHILVQRSRSAVKALCEEVPLPLPSASPPSVLCSIERYKDHYRNVLRSSFGAKLDPKVSMLPLAV